MRTNKVYDTLGDIAHVGHAPRCDDGWFSENINQGGDVSQILRWTDGAWHLVTTDSQTICATQLHAMHAPRRIFDEGTPLASTCGTPKTTSPRGPRSSMSSSAPTSEAGTSAATCAVAPGYVAEQLVGISCTEAKKSWAEYMRLAPTATGSGGGIRLDNGLDCERARSIDGTWGGEFPVRCSSVSDSRNFIVHKDAPHTS